MTMDCSSSRTSREDTMGGPQESMYEMEKVNNIDSLSGGTTIPNRDHLDSTAREARPQSFAAELKQLGREFMRDWKNLGLEFSNEWKTISTELFKDWEFLRADLSDEWRSLNFDLSRELNALSVEFSRDMSAMGTDLARDVKTFSSEFAHEVKQLSSEFVKEWSAPPSNVPTQDTNFTSSTVNEHSIDATLIEKTAVVKDESIDPVSSVEKSVLVEPMENTLVMKEHHENDHDKVLERNGVHQDPPADPLDSDDPDELEDSDSDWIEVEKKDYT